MRRETIPELQSLPEAEQIKVRLAVTPGSFKDPRVWGAYIAQITGFVVLFLVFFPTAQPRMLLILAYAIPTMIVVRSIHRRVIKERVIAFLANNSAS